jgi:chain length determinant protein tyrosine kinase EpsG
MHANLFAPDRRGASSIGTILMEAGLLRSNDLDQIQCYAAERGLKFGEAGVQMNKLRQEDVDLALSRQFNYPTLPIIGSSSVAEEMIAVHSPTSALVEPLRDLRNQLTYRWFNTTKRKVLAVVSPGRREGRSWLAANLATVFAHSGERTLLIDADFRQPRQHNMFKLAKQEGLSALLTGRAGAEVIQPIHPQLRLFVLPAGEVPPNPQELLAHAAFAVVLERCIENFDLVIIDTPAAAQNSDAQILAAHAGSALLLVHCNHTRTAELNATVASLNETGVEFVGSVVNER